LITKGTSSYKKEGILNRRERDGQYFEGRERPDSIGPKNKGQLDKFQKKAVRGGGGRTTQHNTKIGKKSGADRTATLGKEHI